jgi:hypothetical protein
VKFQLMMLLPDTVEWLDSPEEKDDPSSSFSSLPLPPSTSSRPSSGKSSASCTSTFSSSGFAAVAASEESSPRKVAEELEPDGDLFSSLKKEYKVYIRNIISKAESYFPKIKLLDKKDYPV